MNFQSVFPQTPLSKTELTVLGYIYTHPQRCIENGVRAVSAACYSSPSTLVRLAKKLGFRGWLELVYFIKFNLIKSTADHPAVAAGLYHSRFMTTRPEDGMEAFLDGLRHQRLLIHGSGFSQLVAQYFYNKCLTVGINSYLALWPDLDILGEKGRMQFDCAWVISKSGRSHSALAWLEATRKINLPLICFTGDGASPLAMAAQRAFIFDDHQKYDDDIYYANPFFGYCLLGFERIIGAWLNQGGPDAGDHQPAQ
ncbi:MurR/RpiR family transcriptional regulator [Brenneria corticis]|uniref:MurR/RpiR family transcriptional regulator n=1 Tax=Brenneria corticis TaxID=2173106 RepID=A0A2U1TUG6_9GAMM|nr:MurR/RpiR family transcriptional regulator [Brenneria sp. CFCC 11842]PWC13056.1 MurR/RpiR family transcriptional regulator [Brenneria sp. CFCC 11842]